MAWQFYKGKKGTGMHHDTRSAQPPPRIDRSGFRSFRWLVAAVAFCGALAGGSIVEAIAAMASGTSISFALDHLVAGPLVLAGAVSGGLLAAILASRDRNTGHRADKVVVDALAFTDYVPSEPLMWQPAPPMFPIASALTSVRMSPARSKRGVRGRIHQDIGTYHPGRLVVSQSAAMLDRSRYRGLIHHFRQSEKEAGAG